MKLVPLVAKPQPVFVNTIDLEIKTCVHELARALEEYAIRQHIPLFSTTVEFENAAMSIAEKLGAEPCPMKAMP